ncbi:MAG: metallophosphoesterase family protein [Anaerolineae bacterium]|jgi:predicted phosphodiesterase|nr:metallophosphoesterase family protein [Anaerolineae bacterium]MBT3713469.1 metallophosphoesterase family protein [Anaerolineae bacterium]MBT4310991.1 metallophosphoesterase family protein [Anaerolineae bacterium]MBT4459719.1 metallophosphoesterase family protein [Anaerolineae bacterium]MBT4841851.1 metallophosphoesterase family protein [Anaerolineae bacterium]
MRVLVVSDIHANYPAFESVLKDADGFDAVWCLGDVVGYGPDPNACVELLSEQPNLVCVPGNHDIAAMGDMPSESFNGDARRSLLWQQRVLSASSLDFLHSLPHQIEITEKVTLVHGSPRDPVWEYILNTLSARLNFLEFETDYCFVGHTHVPSIFSIDAEQDRVVLDIPRIGMPLQLNQRAILNPGSVGQPRDRDPRAAYAIFDTEALTWEPQRVEYDIESVQARIREARLPERHALRLGEGW